MSTRMPLTAYRVTSGSAPELTVAPATREWMSATRDGFANRCLPLLIANQAGWLVTTPHTVVARWDGGDRLDDVRVDIPDSQGYAFAASHFGSGILTFTIPYLVRTPPGWNLWVRGPTNLPKDGACALDGIVETDWCPATFTMNWKLTRPGLTVRFERDEPVAMLIPTRRGELEAFEPEVRAIDDDGDVARDYRAWRQGRADFLRDLPVPGTTAHEEVWQKDYMHGRRADGSTFPQHQRKLTLRPFRKP